MSTENKLSILELRDKHKLTFKEIGELHDITVAVARERYHREKRLSKRPPHWTDELTAATRNALVYGYYNVSMDEITKEKVTTDIQAGIIIKFPNLGKIKYKEICEYLGIVPETSPAATLQPVTTIFLIEKVWIDESENDLGKAMGYEPCGFMTNEKKAQAYVKSAGFKKGTGWPIPEGQEVPMMKMTRVKRID